MRNSPTAGIEESSDYDSTQFRDHRNQNQAKEANIPHSYQQQEQQQRGSSSTSMSHNTSNDDGVVADGEEALLDLVQLEELHQEAERMKALGNKHMAAQEYTRAYNAYSAALQLSPVGPSSHVFLSNRAAALLSLKRYSAAATDARRAVALAPTFGKAHARLGQALYFLKDYAGAVAAYEDAIQYEPDNQVTQTYLEKAKAKLSKQQDKAQRYARGEDVSIADYSAVSTVINSVATDPNASAAIVSGEFQRSAGNNAALANAIAGRNQKIRYGGGMGSNGKYSINPMMINQNAAEEEDPDFDESINIQKRANRFLANKQYKQAIEEYTAALFLVPDDPNLSPQLHLGRAHALNGSRRHASARNDAQLAIKIQPSAEAYSTLAKSLFYLKDYEDAVEAFHNTIKLLPDGESLSQFDQAYLKKAEAAMSDEVSQHSSPRKSPNKSSPIPKLPPPRFVPREQAIHSTPNRPSMPKAWPQQSPRSPTALRCGPEREVIFFSESLGIKLNRGPDGIIRVLSVSKETPGSPLARKGEICVGDVVRSAAGVDTRLPLTNIMWGDTVALLRLSPRPTAIIVAKELSEVPQSVLEQRRLAQEEDQASQAAAKAMMGDMRLEERPSPASGEEAVADSLAAQSQPDAVQPKNLESANESEELASHGDTNEEIGANRQKCGEENKDGVEGGQETSIDAEGKAAGACGGAEASPKLDDIEPPSQDSSEEATGEPAAKSTAATSDASGTESGEALDEQHGASESARLKGALDVPLRDEEMHLLGAEVLFPRSNSPLAFSGWDNLRWMSHAGVRKIQHCMYVEKLSVGDKKSLNIFGFGATSSDKFLPRKLVIYSEPSLILLLRPPNGPDELRELLDLPEGTQLDGKEHSMQAFLVVDTAMEPKSCKMRLSPLTTPTSVSEDDADIADPRRRSCFYIQTPMESIGLTAIAGKKSGVSYSDSGAFLEATSAELTVGKALCQVHEQDSAAGSDLIKHQVILGSLHSYVVLGSQTMLERAIMTAMQRSKDNVTAHGSNAFLHTRIVDRLDDRGLTPLHYACFRRFNSAVALLVKAGARVDIRTEQLDMAAIHLCAQNLDHKGLSIILSSNFPVKPNPNMLDSLGRTPMYIAAIDGRGPQRQRDAASLGRCIMALEAWGGMMILNPASSKLRSPLSLLATQWRNVELSEVLKHSILRYPLPSQLVEKQIGISIGAFYQYPLHSSVVSLLKEIQLYYENEGDASFGPFGDPQDDSVSRTILTLMCHGFEPNERLDMIDGLGSFASDCEEFLGYAPIQILACAAMEAENLKGRVNEGLLERIMTVIADIADAMVRNGARLSLDPPPLRRLVALKSDLAAGGEDDGPLIDAYDRNSLKIESNKKLLNLLGGSDRLNASKKVWQESKSTPAPPAFKVPFEHEASYEEKPVAGGSSEKSCAICWAQFGSIRNRKHKCRITERYVCDDCSAKRVSFEGNEIRLSDGQFLLARADLGKAERESLQTKRAQDEAQIEKMKEAHTKARQSRLSEEAQRESLFGGVLEAATGLVFGEDQATPESTPAAQVEGLSESLGQTRNALLERGDKLESLGDKTSQMVDASAEFANMAKELRKQSEKGFFSW